MVKVVLIFLMLTYNVASFLPQDSQDANLSNKLDFEISAENPSNRYLYLFEPIHINLILKNKSNLVVKGGFNLSLRNTSLELYYRKGGGEFRQYSCGWQDNPNGGRTLPLAINANEKYSREEILAFDTKQKKFLFDELGEYEFKAVYWETFNDPNTRLESNIIGVQVVNPPDPETGALNLYSNEGVARLVQRDSFDSVESYKEAIKRALLLAKQYPGSLYTEHLRTGQFTRLNSVVSSSSALDEEQHLYILLQEKTNK